MTTEKVHKIIAGSLFIIMFGFYLMTVAPTLSFWDCGEFITCSFMMGIPHPPGSPFLSLIGRVFSLIPFYDFRGVGFEEIAYRVNMIDVILGALTVMFTYMIMVRLIHKFRPPKGDRLENAITMFSAVITAVLVGFSDEFWSNAIETETYMPSLFMSMLAVWLTLKWDERSNDPRAVRYLFLASYLLGLGNGVHLTVLLIAPTIFLFVLFTQPKWFSDPKLWLTGCLFMIGAAIIKMYTGLGVLYVSMALFALAAPLYIYLLYLKRQPLWVMVFLGMMVCGSVYVLGFWVYPTVMVRAGKSPSINEGNPDNWERYKLYMAREQYGQENMYVNMFTRFADFKYQFGYMYLRYLIQQFPKWGPVIPVTFENNRSPESPGQDVRLVKVVYISVFLLSLLIYGFFTHAREDWKRFSALMLFFLASSIGLALYLNMKNPQVRERAYFFLGSYYIIIYWVGMGIYGILTDVREWLIEKKLNGMLMPVTVSLFVIFSTIAPVSVLSNHIDPHYNNYQAHDRTGDWAPWDYGYNILTSCEENAILFTNGDNDTFPLWYVQEVKGFRKDIRIVNLSLLNTEWYILQMKYEGVTIPIQFSDEHIVETLCGRDDDDLAHRLWPVEGQDVEAGGIKWNLPTAHRIPVGDGTEIGMIRVQDVMVFKIIDWAFETRPVYFAVTVAKENKIGLDDHLAMEGMVLRLVKEPSPPGQPNVNVARLDDNAFNNYNYRSLNDDSFYKPPNTRKLVTNYFIGFAQLCERYLTMGDKESAIRAAHGAIDKTTHDLPKRLLLYKLLVSGKVNEELKEFLDDEINKPDFRDGLDGTMRERLEIAGLLNVIGESEKADAVIEAERSRINRKKVKDKLEFGTALLQSTLDKQSYDFFNELTQEEPDNVEVWKAYTAALYSVGKIDEAMMALDRILELVPGDRSAIETKKVISAQLKKNTTVAPDTTNTK
ncbi:protein O-mannosyl-transferase family [Candidatus Latescibacterota bacterium]